MSQHNNDRLVKLANDVSDLVNAAVKDGVGYDEAASMIVMVAADYGRAEYGDGFVFGLANLALKRLAEPLPADISRN